MALTPPTGAVVTQSPDRRRAATSEPRAPVSMLMSQIDHMVVLFGFFSWKKRLPPMVLLFNGVLN